ncbi:MAG: hypothetical protein RRX95_06880, partial [Oscillospiraceae bacterium]
GIWLISQAGKLILGRREDGAMTVDFEKKAPFKKTPIFVVIGVWAVYFAVTIGSSVIFNVSAFRDQLPDYRTGEFSQEIQIVDTNQIPIVDKDLAVKLADKKLGEKPSLGSQVVLGTPTIQTVDGKLVWVVPLQHSGFFKWITNMKGTPGYIIVSATNTQDVRYVDDYNIKYQANAYFFDNLFFHTRFTAALFNGTTDYSFELDDTGKPYWVISTYKYTRGFSLPEATGVIVMDVETGKSEKYSIADVPKWVDRVQPEDFILRQINNKGEYVHGIFNFSDKDKYRASEGHIIVYNNGRCYLFTGITSVGSDESAIGFVMVDMVTKEPVMYQMSGATEKAAQGSAQGKVQQFGYYATFPLIINVDGIPTYFMALKDADGLIKQYAYVSVRDYLVVGVGENVVDARINYIKTLKNSGVDSSKPVDDEDVITLSGTVDRIGQQYAGEVSVYRLIIKGQPYIFDAESILSEQLALTKEGDTVEITFHRMDGAKAMQVVKFANKNLEQNLGVSQPLVEEKTSPEVVPTPSPEIMPTPSPDTMPQSDPPITKS